MKPINEVSLALSIFKEGETYVAYSPSLDLSTAGSSISEVKKNFAELVELFFDETQKHGTTEDILFSLGWEKARSKTWTPPLEIEHTTTKVSVPS